MNYDRAYGYPAAPWPPLRLPCPRIAAARVRIKRTLRRAGVPVRWDATTAELAALLRLARPVRS